jgi:hypothetical protein
LDAGIIFGNHSDIVLDDTLAEIFPSLVCFLIFRLIRSRIKNVSATEMWTKELSNFWPSHEFVDGKKFEELSIERYLSITDVFLHTVEEVGLFVVVGSEDNVVNDSLQDLNELAYRDFEFLSQTTYRLKLLGVLLNSFGI